MTLEKTCNYIRNTVAAAAFVLTVVAPKYSVAQETNPCHELRRTGMELITTIYDTNKQRDPSINDLLTQGKHLISGKTKDQMQHPKARKKTPCVTFAYEVRTAMEYENKIVKALNSDATCTEDPNHALRMNRFTSDFERILMKTVDTRPDCNSALETEGVSNNRFGVQLKPSKTD